MCYILIFTGGLYAGAVTADPNLPTINIGLASPAEHEKGSFTGATDAKAGQFELCHKGTLFLDEIGDMGLPTQTKILRAIQEGEIQRVGATKVKKVDVRLIGATHKNLEEMVKTKEFREDLYYRLNVVRIETPPLRERLEDIPELINLSINQYERLSSEHDSIRDLILERFSPSRNHGNWVETINKVLKGQDPLHILGEGNQVRCYTNGKDISRGIVTAMEHENALNECFNISIAEATTVLELAEKIWNKLNPDKEFNFTTEDPYTHDVQKRIPSVAKAEKLLGYKAEISLDESLDEVIGYMKKKQ